MEPTKQPAARLRWGEEECLLFPGDPIRLGRSVENEIVLNDPKISRSHAEIEWNGAGFTLRDLGSINGTFVNGQRLSNTTYLLRDGDEIALSKVTLFYEIVRAEPVEPPAAHVPTGRTEPLEPRGASLVVTGGPDMGQVYPLWGDTITIGRASREATWEIRLTDRSISRPHARLEQRDDGVYLVDLESVNGTQLNDVRVHEPVALSDGDVITVGETLMVFHFQ